MSRTRKKDPPRRGTGKFMRCPRHGYCSWCDRNRLHNKIKTDLASDQDLKEVKELAHWQDLWDWDEL